MFTLATMLALAGLQTTVLAQKCGNTNAPGVTPPCKCKGQGVNPINPTSSDVARDVQDLEVWGGIGQHQLVWERYGHSRMTAGKLWFGSGHCWRHSYQWEMSVSGNTLTLNYPDGTVYTYTLTNSAWVGAPSNPDLLTQNGTNYVLQTANGWQYSFNQYPSPLRYQLDKITDAQGNVYNLTYDVHYRFSRVTEPGGRWLQVTYQDIPVDSEAFTTLATCTNNPPDGQWTTLPVSNTNAYQMVRFLGDISSYGNLAEVQFLDTNNNVLTGTPFGTTPPYTTNSSSYLSLFDGNTNTFFNFAYANYSFAGLDLGSKHRIAAIRFFPRPGYASRANGSFFQGANVLSTTQTAITSVQTSDGRRVTYNYGATPDTVLASDFLTLTNVAYGDGTQATYGYVQTFAGQRLLLSSASDPRVEGNATQLRYAYYTNLSSGLFGSIFQEMSYATGQMADQLGADGVHASNSIVTYANGAVETISDNGCGYFTKVADALGRTTTYTYSAGGTGFIISTTDPLGHTTSFTRDSQGRLLTSTAPDGGVTTYTYDSLGQPLTVTDPLGHTTTYTRDSQHRPTLIQYPDGSTEAYTYNSFSQPLTHTLRNGGVESFGYTTNGLKTAYTNALGNVTTYTYYSNSLPATVTDANGHTTTYTYTERGLPLQVMNSDYSVKSYGYDGFGNSSAVTNELGAVWQTVYDEYRRPTAKIDPLGRTTVYDYSLPGSGGCSCANSQNKPTSITLPGGEITKITYDLEWQLLNQTVGYGTADAAMTQYQYNAAGLVIAMIDPNGRNWTYGYDASNRRISTTDPLSHVTQWSYDLAGNKLTETRADGRVTTNSYDTMNRVVSSTDPLSHTTQMGYDVSGNLTSLTDANGNVTYWSYDLLNRQTVKTYADSTQDKYGFDAVGNLIGFTNAAGQVASYTYDNRNRLTQTVWNDGVTPIVTRSYDIVGRLTALNNGNAAEGYTYDAANQLLAETNFIGGATFVTAYGYDLDGRKHTLVYPSGNTLTNTFTARNQVKAIYANGPPPLATFTYDLNGNRLSLALNNGVTNGYAYDNASRLTSLVSKQGSATVASFAYTYNNINDRTALVREGGRTENYGYDAARQLTGATYGDTTSEGFNYDAMGNLNTRTNVAGGVDSFNVNNLNQYTAINGNATSFDAKGNLLSWTGGAFGYDAQNRLVGASRGTNGAIFVYDGRNRCVQRVINGTTTTFIYDSWDLIAEYSGTTPIAEYIHGPVTDETLARATAIGTVYYTGDALNSVATLTDGSGNVVEKYRYTAFGQPTIYDTTGTNILFESAYGNRFAFQGREWFAEINLTDHRNRYYSPELNRWLNRDPINEQCFKVMVSRSGRFNRKEECNLYRFVANSPDNYTDSLGLKICCSECQKFLAESSSNENILNALAGAEVVGGAIVGAVGGVVAGVVVGVTTENPYAGATAGVAVGGLAGGHDLYDGGRLLDEGSERARRIVDMYNRCMAHCE